MDEQYTYLGDGTGGIDYLAVPALALLGTLAVDKLCGTASDTTRMQQAVVAAIVALGVKLIADLLVRLDGSKSPLYAGAGPLNAAGLLCSLALANLGPENVGASFATAAEALRFVLGLLVFRLARYGRDFMSAPMQDMRKYADGFTDVVVARSDNFMFVPVGDSGRWTIAGNIEEDAVKVEGVPYNAPAVIPPLLPT